MTQTIKAIETSYAGCRFRSRTEARWAVFFDALGTPWTYEPQGYTVGPDRTPYLPDFYLPDLELWVEVKGRMTAENLRTLIFAASTAGLPYTPDRELPRNMPPHAQRILILGDFPEPGKAHTHLTLDVIGDLVVLQTVFGVTTSGGKPKFFPIGQFRPLNQFVAGAEPNEEFLQGLTEGNDLWFVRPFAKFTAAYTAARSARFEHGERG